MQTHAPAVLEAGGRFSSLLNIPQSTQKGRWYHWGAEISSNVAESRVKQAVCSSQLGPGLMNQGWEMTSKLWPPRRSMKGPCPVPQGAFGDHLTQLWVALVVARHLQSPALQHPPSCSWQRQVLAVPSGHWAAKVSAQLPPSCHSRLLLQLGKQLVMGISQAWGLGGGGGWSSSRARVWTQWYFFFFTREIPVLLLCTSFVPAKNRNGVCAANVGRPGKSCDCSLAMLSKGPISLLLFSGWWSILVGRAGHHKPSSWRSVAPQGQPAETQSASVQLKVLLFLLLAEQTAVTQKMCAGEEGETQPLALTTADAILVPELLLARSQWEWNGEAGPCDCSGFSSAWTELAVAAQSHNCCQILPFLAFRLALLKSKWLFPGKRRARSWLLSLP